MNDALADQIKGVIGYRDGTPKVCGNCDHSVSVPPGIQSCVSELHCAIVKELGTFHVKRDATCMKHRCRPEPKSTFRP
jgi:hypothetical protein